MSNRLFHSLCVISACLTMSGFALAQNCAIDSATRKSLCAPPGGYLYNSPEDGGIVCGVGECTIDDYTKPWKLMCSSVPGGAVTKSASNRLACVGQCVPPRRSNCIIEDATPPR